MAVFSATIRKLRTQAARRRRPGEPFPWLHPEYVAGRAARPVPASGWPPG